MNIKDIKDIKDINNDIKDIKDISVSLSHFMIIYYHCICNMIHMKSRNNNKILNKKFILECLDRYVC
jgi:hypothetical protein